MREKFMSEALKLAQEAFLEGEVPVGAVIVKDGEIISTGRNRREKTKNALSHAEIEAINEACKVLNSWRLEDCELYVTLEPCPMCAGGIWNARLSRVVYGAKDARAGAMGSVFHINSYPVNWKPVVESGVLAEECREVMRKFFVTRR